MSIYLIQNSLKKITTPYNSLKQAFSLPRLNACQIQQNLLKTYHLTVFHAKIYKDM